MTNLPIKYFPKAESFEVSTAPTGWSSYRNFEYFQIAPYSSEEKVKTIISERGIKIPFKEIVTRYQGTSACPHCAAIYGGDQPYCTQIVNWITYDKNEYYKNQKARFNGEVGEIYSIHGWGGIPHRYKIKTTYKDLCDSRTTWSLQKEFDEQAEFFRFVEFIGTVQIDRLSQLQKYESHLPKGSLTEYRLRVLEDEIDALRSLCARYESAITTIAQKMNQAGHSLSF